MSDTPPRLQELSKPAHPMPGFLAIAPFPMPDDGSTTGSVSIQSLFGTISHEVTVGLLLEAGAVPEGSSDQIAPWTERATVYYFKASAITVGGFHYVPMSSIIAWAEAPE